MLCIAFWELCYGHTLARFPTSLTLILSLSSQTNNGTKTVEIVVTKEQVLKKLGDLLQKQDLSRYVL